jgi:hypothetical protein
MEPCLWEDAAGYLTQGEFSIAIAWGYEGHHQRDKLCKARSIDDLRPGRADKERMVIGRLDSPPDPEDCLPSDIPRAITQQKNVGGIVWMC